MIDHTGRDVAIEDHGVGIFYKLSKHNARGKEASEEIEKSYFKRLFIYASCQL